MLIGDDPLFLILRAYNYWDFPKGRVEPSEDPFVAALRELEEETGISKVTHPWGQEFIETEPYANHKVARYYMAEVSSREVVLGINPELGRAEHSEFRWVTTQEAEKLLVPRLQRVLRWACEKIETTLRV